MDVKQLFLYKVDEFFHIHKQIPDVKESGFLVWNKKLWYGKANIGMER